MIKFGTLFSGIGAPEFALKKLNIPFESSFACEIDEFARKSFLANHNININKFYKDIYSINTDELDKNIDLLVAGFPCQAFSTVGKREGINDKKGRGILYLEMMRIIEATLPETILLENVKGITFNKHKELLNDLYDRLNRLGYSYDYKILNTLNITGIPQNRNRWFLVAFKNKERFNNFEFPKDNEHVQDIKNFLYLDTKIGNQYYDTPYRFLKNFYINLNDKSDGVISYFTSTREYQGFTNISGTLLALEYKSPKCVKTKKLDDIIQEIIESGFDFIGYKNYIEKTFNINIKNIKQSNFDLNVAKTFGFDYEKIKHLYRKICPEECLNLQGFPKTFKQVVSDSQLIKQVGNSMTVDIISKIISNILKA